MNESSKKYNKTLLLVTHDISLAKKGGQCLKIVKGRLENANLKDNG